MKKPVTGLKRSGVLSAAIIGVFPLGAYVAASLLFFCAYIPAADAAEGGVPRAEVALDENNCVVCRKDLHVFTFTDSTLKWEKEPGLSARKKISSPLGTGSYALRTRVKSDGPAGVIFGARESADYIVFYLNPEVGMCTLGEYRGAGNKTRKEVFNSPVKEELLSKGKWHEIAVLVDESGYFRFFVDDVFVAEWKWTGEPPGSGVGLWDGDGKAEFSELEVRLTALKDGGI